jgi:hypothetical protein
MINRFKFSRVYNPYVQQEYRCDFESVRASIDKPYFAIPNGSSDPQTWA